MTHIALYPGTFDPITNGHSELVERATRVFDEVIVAIAANPTKLPLFTLEERVELARAVLAGQKRVRVIGFDTLLVECARQHGARILLRGLRAVSDFEYEFQMAGMNRRLDPSIETVFMTPSERETYISASLVKEIAALGADVTEFVHARVKDALLAKLR